MITTSDDKLLFQFHAVPVEARRFMLRAFRICCPELDESRASFDYDALLRTYAVNARMKMNEIGQALKASGWVEYSYLAKVLSASEDRNKVTVLGIKGPYTYLSLYKEICSRLHELQEYMK